MTHPAPPLDPRLTEQRNPATAAIDLASPIEIVDLMSREDARVASGELARARDSVAALEADAVEAAAESAALERQAAAAAEQLAALPRLAREAAAAPGSGLGAIEPWAARARAALLVLHGTLATERDAVVREANELGSAVLGEPLGATGVPGVRERVERALQSGSP